MKILVLNCGSSSVKLQLIETDRQLMERAGDRVLAKALVDRIGAADAVFRCEAAGGPLEESRQPVADHAAAIRIAVERITALAGDGVIDGVGHRMVHGGEYFAHSVLLNEEVARKIEECSEFAPLHNPHNLRGYYAARNLLPGAPQVAVFDTAFHQTLPPWAFLYGLPYEAYERHRVRRYGFHGTSHRYVTERYAQLHGGRPEDFKLITCHLGNGCSMTAVDRGRAVDTSMGFTPLEGLLMGTRAGDVDAAAVLYLMDREHLGIEQALALLNQRSGLLGVSGISNDIRELIARMESGDERAELAIRMFCYRVRKYLGAYYAVLNGADAVIFTGGIGENRPLIRARICESLDALGIAIDPPKNEAAIAIEADISAEDAPTQVWVIPTNEELLIARETALCIGKRESDFSAPEPPSTR